ncbi:MAG: hypothetical protein IJT73_10605 [Selenomonadaceae bacterium]|nr:hypothetical protein [Selenomonadaceae bacterium]
MSKIFFVAFTGFFLIRNILMPLAHDDFAYAFIWDGEKGGNLSLIPADETLQQRERVQSFGDIFKSQYSHYFTWGGRVFAHSLAQFFIWIGKPYFDIANTIVLALLVIVILKLADVKESARVIFWIFTGLLFLTAESVVTMLWLTGACNYLWMCLFQMLFLLPYVQTFRAGIVDKSKLKIPLMLFLGLLAGWSNESGALATLCLTVFFILLLKKKSLLQFWMVAGFLTLAAGCAFNILAPGNFVQMQFIQSVNPNFKYTPELFINHLTEGFLPVLEINLIVLLPLIYYFFKRGFRNLNAPEIVSLTFTAGGLIVPLSMIFSPKFDLRVSIISIVFCMVASVWTLSELKIKLPRVFCKVAVLVIFLYSATLIYSDLSVNRAVNENINYIQEHKSNAVITLQPMNFSKIFLPIQKGKTAIPALKYFGGINDNPNFYLNVMISQYYGVKRIVSTK